MSGQAFVRDTFTGSSGADLVSGHTGEVGATYTLQTGSNTVHFQISDANRGRISDGEVTFGQVLASGIPDSAEYETVIDLVVKSITTDQIGLAVRADPAAVTYYTPYLDQGLNTWNLAKSVAGVFTALGSVDAGVVVGQTYSMRMSTTTPQKSIYVNGALVLGTSDDTITAAGQVGLAQGAHNASSDTTGVHFDNFVASNPLRGVLVRN